MKNTGAKVVKINLDSCFCRHGNFRNDNISNYCLHSNQIIFNNQKRPPTLAKFGLF